ncbi:hypothetical protein CEN49_24860 [Fischerella thermalis CCMEE 5273]|nr:hypothetical protein CEN49_24860 [Fischerella thermalis CCMEE 5273]
MDESCADYAVVRHDGCRDIAGDNDLYECSDGVVPGVCIFGGGSGVGFPVSGENEKPDVKGWNLLSRFMLNPY